MGRSGRRWRRGRRIAGAVTVLALGSGAAGCGAVQAGSAAVIGGTALSQRQLENRTTAYLDSLTSSQRSQVQGSLATAQRSILNEMVLERLVGRAADQAGVSVSPAQVSAQLDQAVQTSGNQLQSQLAQAFLTREQLPDLLRLNLQVFAIGRAGSTATLTDAQAAQRAISYITSPDRDLAVTVNPQYGSWQGTQIADANGSLSVLAPNSRSGPAPTAPAEGPSGTG